MSKRGFHSVSRFYDVSNRPKNGSKVKVPVLPHFPLLFFVSKYYFAPQMNGMRQKRSQILRLRLRNSLFWPQSLKRKIQAYLFQKDFRFVERCYENFDNSRYCISFSVMPQKFCIYLLLLCSRRDRFKIESLLLK